MIKSFQKIQNPFVGRMFIFFLVFSCYSLINNGCCNDSESNNQEEANTIGAILNEGGSRYDVADFLLNNPEYKDEKQENGEYDYYYDSMLSADGKVRIYSICEELEAGYLYQFANIAHYNTVDFSMMVKADLDFSGLIHQIGFKKIDGKVYYLFVSCTHCERQGEWWHFFLTAYSLNEENGDFKQESIFKTKDGRMLNSIEVHWDDFGYRYSADNLWGIALDSESNTEGIYIQLVDAVPGKPHDVALVYKWDGSCFSYTGKEPAHFPVYKDN